MLPGMSMSVNSIWMVGVLLQQRNGLIRVTRFRHLEAIALQKIDDVHPNQGLVFHHQHVHLGHVLLATHTWWAC